MSCKLDTAGCRQAITITWAGLLAALSLTIATPALGARPELGRCVKAPAGLGEYRNDGCTEKGLHGEYAWRPGPGPNPAFSANFGWSFATDAILYSAHTEIDCPFNVSEGEYTGPKTLKMTIVLWQCKIPTGAFEWKALCQEFTTGNRPPGKLISGPLESEIGQIRMEVTGKLGFFGESKSAGIELKPAVGSVLAIFECGGATQEVQLGTGTGTFMALEGGVIEHWLAGYEGSPAVNHMVTLYKTRFKGTGSVQEPEKLAGEPNATLTLVNPLLSPERHAEPAFFNAEEEVESEEPIELNLRV